MRPGWLKCAGCLFYTQDNTEDRGNYPPCFCRFSPKGYTKRKESFCSHWVCRRCLQPWRTVEWEYVNPERQNGWEFWSVQNHFTCGESGEHKERVEPEVNLATAVPTSTGE